MTQRPKLGKRITSILIVTILFSIAFILGRQGNQTVIGNWGAVVIVFLFAYFLSIFQGEPPKDLQKRWDDLKIDATRIMAWRDFQEERRAKTSDESAQTEPQREQISKPSSTPSKKKRRRMVR